jgi:capsular polysaccharide biosynthesis protein
MQKIILMVLVLGLGLGGGLAYLVEMMDPSFKTPEELEEELEIPVLVSMPIRYTEREQRNMRLKEISKAASVAVGFVICAVGIVFVTKGIDATVNYVKTALANLGVL